VTTTKEDMLVFKVQCCWPGGDVVLDADRLRTAFIKDQVERLLKHRRASWSARAVQELRRYFGWFADSIPQSEKETIAAQLSKLEREASKHD
jgi:hypothetical protein